MNKRACIISDSSPCEQIARVLASDGFAVTIITDKIRVSQELKYCAGVGQINVIHTKSYVYDIIEQNILEGDLVINMLFSQHAMHHNMSSYAKISEQVAKISCNKRARSLFHMITLTHEDIYIGTLDRIRDAVMASFKNSVFVYTGLTFGEENDVLDTMISNVMNCSVSMLTHECRESLKFMHIHNMIEYFMYNIFNNSQYFCKSISIHGSQMISIQNIVDNISAALNQIKKKFRVNASIAKILSQRTSIMRMIVSILQWITKTDLTFLSVPKLYHVKNIDMHVSIDSIDIQNFITSRIKSL